MSVFCQEPNSFKWIKFNEKCFVAITLRFHYMPFITFPHTLWRAIATYNISWNLYSCKVDGSIEKLLSLTLGGVSRCWDMGSVLVHISQRVFEFALKVHFYLFNNAQVCCNIIDVLTSFHFSCTLLSFQILLRLLWYLLDSWLCKQSLYLFITSTINNVYYIYYSPLCGKHIALEGNTKRMLNFITRNGWKIKLRVSLMLPVTFFIHFFMICVWFYNIFTITVEAYKKGIMKGGAAIPPPGNLNIPGSKCNNLKLFVCGF